MKLSPIERKVLRLMAGGAVPLPPYTSLRQGAAVIQWHLRMGHDYVVQVDYQVLVGLVKKGLLRASPPNHQYLVYHSFRLTDTGLCLGFFEMERRRAYAC